MSSREFLHAYRQLYRTSLQAIQYASPARHTLRKLLNTEFRLGDRQYFDPKKIENTLHFLQAAANSRGLEHRIVKSLLHIWWFNGNKKHMKPEYDLIIIDSLMKA